MYSFRQKLRRALNSAYLRVTLSKITISFFLLSFSFTFIQGLIYAFVWTGDSTAYSEVNSILLQADVPTYLLPWLHRSGDEYSLSICSAVPYGANNVNQICTTVFDTMDGPQPTWLPPAGYKRSLSIPRNTANQSATITLPGASEPVSLSEQCTRVLLYPAYILRKSQDEDLALIFAQFWLLVISSAAVLSQSISHVLAVFGMRLLTTGWSAYTLWRTNDIQHRFDRLVLGSNSACGVDLFQGYFKTRISLQVPDLVLNALGFLYAAILGWRLIQSFSVNTFNCVGPPAKIVRLYRYLLTVVACEKLLLYSMITFMALGLKQGILAKATLIALYMTIFIISMILVPFMLVLGYYATRYEKRRLMIVFIVLLFTFIGGFVALFAFPTFRFTWIQWPFLACLSGICAAQLICCTAFAILCRVHCREGLSHYLHVQSVLSDEDFEPDEFSTTEDAKIRGTNRLSAAITSANLPVLRRDSNWDFADLERNRTRPPIYIVDLSDDSFKR